MQTPMIISLHSRKSLARATFDRSLAALVFAFAISLGLPAQAFPDARDPVPASWHGPVFRLSQNYPTSVAVETLPWNDIDPRNRPEDYIRAVFRYCLQGNVESDWSGIGNRVRPWFHAPWMHWGRNGREFVHGLTYERVSLAGELAPSQTQSFQNWAVGLYNVAGGYTIGQVWRNPNAPDPHAGIFPAGTVSVKLLFTQATPDQVPFLKGAKEWEALIYQAVAIPTNPFTPRSIQKLRLLQIDVAVKDAGVAATGGWVFGTFIYNGLLPTGGPWDRFVPVGVMWGDDPDLSLAAARAGQRPREGWNNPSRDVPPQHLGYAGRLNGPVDNPMSSCLSCHGTAQWPVAAPLVPPRTAMVDSPAWMSWFRHVVPPQAFSPGSVSLDYSLQLASGMANFFEWQDLVNSRGGYTNATSVPDAMFTARTTGTMHFPVTRNGE